MKEEAESLKIFDKIILFTDKDLPESITNHPLYNMERGGGGYWLWKPYIILETLSRIEENDILVYVDAGCQLFQDKEWDEWWELMQTHNGIFFCYGGTIEKFCRRNLIAYYKSNKLFKYYYQIQSGYVLSIRKLTM